MYFAVGYEYTESSKRGKNFSQDFFIISLNAKFTAELYFSLSKRFLENTRVERLTKALFGGNFLCYCKKKNRLNLLMVYTLMDNKHRHTMRAEPMTFCSAMW